MKDLIPGPSLGQLKQEFQGRVLEIWSFNKHHRQFLSVKSGTILWIFPALQSLPTPWEEKKLALFPMVTKVGAERWRPVPWSRRVQHRNPPRTPNLAASEISIFEPTISLGRVKLHRRHHSRTEHHFWLPRPSCYSTSHFSLGHLPAASGLPTTVNSRGWHLKYDTSKPPCELTTPCPENKFPKRKHLHPGRGWGINVKPPLLCDFLLKAQSTSATDHQGWLLCHSLTTQNSVALVWRLLYRFLLRNCDPFYVPLIEKYCVVLLVFDCCVTVSPQT